MATTMISVKNLKKVYKCGQGKTVTALEGISFEMMPGEIFGLLGPNGSGKSTTVGVLTTLVQPTAGEVIVAGINVEKEPRQVKKQIGVVPQYMNLDHSLNVREILTFHAAYFGIAKPERERRTDELLTIFGLTDKAKEKVDRLSGGMQRRVMIARALMHDPKILFLDEPTAGLDPQSRLSLWGEIRKMNARGTTILLTTHYMEEADQLCNRVAILEQGRILTVDTPLNLKNSLPGGHIIELQLAGESERLIHHLQGLIGVQKIEKADCGLRLYIEDGHQVIPRIFSSLNGDGSLLTNLKWYTPSLEDVYVHFTGKGFEK
jgi:ABC-2 type transport system ATP-binding protein